ncbi:hypothetical protein B7463_g11575, partial [Scytalidium lignicola]
MKLSISRITHLAVWVLACSNTSSAHSWVEQLHVIAPNGTFVGTPGYPRGFAPREAGVDPDTAMTQLIPPNGRSTGNEVLPTDLLCKSTQMIGEYTPGSPPLEASPGDRVALRYQENGHVTQPQIPPGKPAGSGTVFIYGTSQPSNNDTFLGVHKSWNADGTGGDGRGVLLATRYFDDGQCYQINGGPISQARQKEFPHTADALMGEDLWCQTDVQIPSDATGNYTLYWVWDWPTLSGTPGYPDGLNQSYTTCMDVVLKESLGNKLAAGASFVKGQNLNSAAIAAEMQTALLVNPSAPFQTYTSGVAPSSPPMVTSGGTSQSASGIVTVTVTAPATILTVTKTVYGSSSPTISPSERSTKSTESIATHQSTSTALQSDTTSSLSPVASSSSSSSAPAGQQPLTSTTSTTSGVPSSTSPVNSPSSSSDSPPPILPFLSPASIVMTQGQPLTPTTLATSASPKSSPATTFSTHTTTSSSTTTSDITESASSQTTSSTSPTSSVSPSNTPTTTTMPKPIPYSNTTNTQTSGSRKRRYPIRLNRIHM